MRRVIQFSTGNVGRHSLRAIIGRPDLELVGVHAASAEKIGRDAAQLCGLDEPTGIIATDDVDALVGLGADCVVYTSQGETRPMEAIDQMAKFLAAGTNVVGTSMVWLVTPRHAEDWLRVPLEQACAAGNTSLYVNGIDPGFSGDTLVHSAVSLTTRVSSITVQEIFDYGNYDDAEFTGAAMGFGTTEDEDPAMMFLPGVIMSMWGGQVRSLADNLDIKLDEVRQRIERWFTPERIDCTMMTVEPGQMAAVRFATEGVRDGEPVITLEHVTRLTTAAAPDWEFPPEGHTGVHRVVVEGEPRVEINTHVSHPVLDSTDAGLHLDGRSGSQCHRLGVPRAPGTDRRGGYSPVCDNARADVERPLGDLRRDGITLGTRCRKTRPHHRRCPRFGARPCAPARGGRSRSHPGRHLPIPPQLEYPLATEEDLAETARLVRDFGRRCVSRVADVRDEEQLRSAVDDGVAELGGLDGAVANAGVLTVAAWDKTTADQWRTVVDVNLIGVWNTCAAAIPHLLAQGGGSLVNISSAGAIKGFPLQTPYTAAKYGVVGLTLGVGQRTGGKECARQFRASHRCAYRHDPAVLRNSPGRGTVRPDPHLRQCDAHAGRGARRRQQRSAVPDFR